MPRKCSASESFAASFVAANVPWQTIPLGMDKTVARRVSRQLNHDIKNLLGKIFAGLRCGGRRNCREKQCQNKPYECERHPLFGAARTRSHEDFVSII